jgi:hypothetical protein
MFCSHLVYFVAIWYICIVVIYIFPRYGTHVVPRKIWQPWTRGWFLNRFQNVKLSSSKVVLNKLYIPYVHMHPTYCKVQKL